MLRKSPNEIERRSILLGTVRGTSWPILIPDEIRREHVHITGSSGSGKSKSVKNPMLLQIINRREEVVIILDLGGDISDVHEFHEAANATGTPFYLFTTEGMNGSHEFNPIAQSYIDAGADVGSLLMQGLGITGPSQEYGKWYFASQAEKRASRQFKAFARPTVRETMQEVAKLPLGELAKRLNLSARDIEHGEQANLELRKIAEIPGANGPGGPDAIDIKRIIGRGGPAIVYFYLPVAHNLTTAVSIARMAIHAVLGTVQKLPREHTPVIVCIDEAQSILGISLQPFYEQIRKCGVSIWTIHPCFQDLMTDKNVLPMVVNNSAVGIHCAVRDMVGRVHIEGTGGKVKVLRRSINASGEVTWSETLEPRISTADFDAVNGDKELAFVTINGRVGYASFNHTFIAQLAGFSCSYAEYRRFLSEPWPELSGMVDLRSFAPPAPPLPLPRAPEERAAQVLAALAAMRAAHTSN
jgi:hypothetical protein